MTLRIGLTGGIASGKSTVANLFAELGAPIIDTDVIARELTEPNTESLQAIVAHFGEQILQPSGKLNRSLLRQIIFRNPAEKTWLENFLHPLIRQQVRSQLRALPATTPYIIIVIPLLAESHGMDFIDRICVVDTPVELQLTRLQQRDNCSAELANAMVQAQATREQRNKIADDIILNAGEIAALKQAVKELDKKFRN